MDKNSQAILNVALDVASRGMPVHPLKFGDKRPLSHHGCKDASKDLCIVKQLFRQYPGPWNYGIATGGESKLVVLDFDFGSKGGEESLKTLLSDFPELDQAPAVRTGGGGLHIYCKSPNGIQIGNKSNALGLAGFDVRGHGGYVVGPGSVHKSGVIYEFLPGKSFDDLPVLELTLELAQQLSRKNPSNSRGKTGYHSPNPIREGARNDTLFRQACSLRGKGLRESETRAIIHHRNEEICSPPISKGEVDRILDSALGYDRPDAHQFTDLGNAKRLVDCFGDQIRFIPERKQWFVWNGTHWGQDVEGRVQQFVKMIAEQMMARAYGEDK